ncbi:MAG: FAD-dependent oxidoreductase [Bacillota bacterium]
MNDVDILVIGAGPAGLAAAAAAGTRASVLVADEHGAPGGQLRKQIHKFFGSSRHFAGKRGFAIAWELEAQARAAGAEFALNTVVYSLQPDLTASLAGPDDTRHVRAQRVILATGASENAVAFPGWTLPGVMTAGAAQTLVNLHRVLPGRRGLIVGSGNVGLVVGFQLAQAGADLAALVEIRPQVGGYSVHAGKLRRTGVPILTSSLLTRAGGAGRVQSAVIARCGADGQPLAATERAFAVDFICLAAGLHPASELARMAGCDCRGDTPIHSPELETTVPGLYVAGDAAGVEEASSAMEEGKLAATHALVSLGRLDKRLGLKDMAACRDVLAQLRGERRLEAGA